MQKFKNGREARQFDQVVGVTYDLAKDDTTRVIAGSIQLDTDPEKDLGYVHVQVPGDVQMLKVKVSDCFHAEDALAALTPKAAATEAAAPVGQS
ncbi:MAG: hypothetical protein JWQ04_2771 [Pedosphaera sp.]|nr:hypothetical protein [Pedosphaera sp.]